jgi:hypothetical protein
MSGQDKIAIAAWEVVSTLDTRCLSVTPVVSEIHRDSRRGWLIAK